MVFPHLLPITVEKKVQERDIMVQEDTASLENAYLDLSLDFGELWTLLAIIITLECSNALKQDLLN